MDSSLTIALAVSGIGLLILFAALLFLYGLMYAMTALIKDRPGETREEPAPAAESVEKTARAARQAAVIAVALARAEMQSRPVGQLPASAGSSSWGQYHRHRLLNLNRRARTSR